MTPIAWLIFAVFVVLLWLAYQLGKLSERGRPVSGAVMIEFSGWKTDSPKVHVGFAGQSPGHSGSCGALTFDDDVIGNAKAEMYAKTYSDILGIPIHDRRSEQK